MSEPRAKILVVDDEETIRLLISRKLLADGYDCVLACDGREALETISTQDFDLVLSDVKMPGMSGIEVLSQIVADHPDTGVVMITAVADAQTAVEAMKLGAYDYVTKPFELDALSTRVEKALERKTLLQENRDYKLREAEEALQDSRRVFRSITEAAQDAIFMLDNDGKATYWNKAAERIFGYGSQEMTGQDLCATISPPHSCEALRKAMDRLSRDSQEAAAGGTLELVARRKDGTGFPAELSMSAVRIREEWSAIGIIRDITERKKGEKAVRHRLELEEAISRISSRFVGNADINFAMSASLHDIGIVTGASRSYLFRIRDDGATMDATHEWAPQETSPEPENLQDVSCADFGWWIERLRKGETVHVDDVSQLPGPALAGAKRLGGPDAESFVALPLTIGGEFDGFLALSDVSRTREWSEDDLLLLRVVPEVIGNALERREAEEQLRQYKEHLEELVEQRTAELKSSHEQLLQSAKLAAIGELVSGVAHEVNNPLAAISMYSELLLDEVNGAPANEHLRIVNTEAERAIAIVENLLSFARKHEPKRGCVSINDCVASTVQLRSYDLNLDNVTVVLELDPDLPETMADFRQLQQVVLNLITNAEQAMKEAHGKGTMTISTRSTGESIVIAIADDGPGIPAEKLDRIFEPFYTTKDVGRGTGLGLSICHGIVQEHSGRIRVESLEGSGATFTVEIPIVAGTGSDESRPCEPADCVPVADSSPE